MNAGDILTRLHHDQREHDLRAHEDVFYLPYPWRMRHLTFHVAKYSGRLASSPTAEEVEKTIVDAFIVALSAADLLKINFSKEFGKMVAVSDHSNLAALGQALDTGEADDGNVVGWYFRQLALIGGRMAKACESLDHMEPVAYRDLLSQAVISLARTSLVTANRLRLDLEGRVRRRWEEIEAERIL
jgi:hypothetical protein